MKKELKPILVTGSHRSGSTWTGKMLAGAPHTAYIREPFNTGIKIGVCRDVFENEWQYVCDRNAAPYKIEIERVINYKYPLSSNLSKISTLLDVVKLVRDQGLFWIHGITNHTPIVKDPIALFSAEWLCKMFDMNVLVLIRHPAAFCSSIKIKRWTIDFNYFLNQPLLMKTFLKKYESEISEYAKNKKNIVEQAILAWNCFHHTISTYQETNPDWLFMRHEDLSLDPVQQFRLIYQKFGLKFTRRAELMILKSTGSHNPVEQQRKNEFNRNSQENIHNWKNRLNRQEIDMIREKTLELSSKFYSADEW